MVEKHEPGNRMKDFILFSFIFLILNISDAALTIFALQNGATEYNPIIAKNINNIFQIKTIGSALIIFIAYLYYTQKENSLLAIKMPAATMSCVVAWGAIQIFLNVII